MLLIHLHFIEKVSTTLSSVWLNFTSSKLICSLNQGILVSNVRNQKGEKNLHHCKNLQNMSRIVNIPKNGGVMAYSCTLTLSFLIFQEPPNSDKRYEKHVI